LESSVLNITLYNRKYKGYSVQQVRDLSYFGFNMPEKYDKPDKQNTLIYVYMWLNRILRNIGRNGKTVTRYTVVAVPTHI